MTATPKFLVGFVDEAGNPIDPNTPPEETNETPASGTVLSAPSLPGPPIDGFPCEISETKVSVPGFVCKGQLLFEDNFNSHIEKGKIWTPEIRFPGEPVSFKNSIHISNTLFF